MPDDALRSALGRVTEALGAAQDGWWVLGSAAVALHGGNPGTIGDIDVLLSERDFAALSSGLSLVDERDGPNPRFRSRLFGTWREPALPVEFMAGFEHYHEGRWRPVAPITRETVHWKGLTISVPGRDELRALLHAFGRDKDLRRAASLSEV